MRALLHEIKRTSDVGTFGQQTATALIYEDKITLREPYEQRTDGHCILAFRVSCIGNQAVVNAARADVVGNRQDGAWAIMREFVRE